MKTLIITLLALVTVGATLMPDTAEAKRFGGGKSFGKQYTMPRQAQPPAAARPPAGAQGAAAGQAGARTSGASRGLGPLAGLAAGGLLASLFFGDGFEGFQVMDFLLIAALVFGGVMLFKMMRRRAAGPAVAGLGRGYSGPVPMGGGFESAGRASPTAAGGAATGADQAPAWFDAAGFVEGAKTHFIRLQAAWDQADFRDIRTYTSSQLFAELQRERERLGQAASYTEVVTLNAELVGVQRDGDQAVASVRFSGLIREEAAGAATPLDEVWHVAHDWSDPDGDWLITGIQQSGAASS